MRPEVEQHLANLINKETSKDVLNILKTSSEPETFFLINNLFDNTVHNLCNSLCPVSPTFGTTPTELKDFIIAHVRSTIGKYYNYHIIG